MERCGATTKTGERCRWPRGECRWHVPAGDEPLPNTAAAASAGPPDPKPQAPESSFPWLEGRDLRGLGWWLIEHILRGSVESRDGSVVAGLVRTLAALGPEESNREEALREVELRGMLMHGMPPRTEEEWELAARVFDDDALAEFRRWERLLLEADHRDGTEPFDLREVRAGDVEVPGGIDRENGG